MPNIRKWLEFGVKTECTRLAKQPKAVTASIYYPRDITP